MQRMIEPMVDDKLLQKDVKEFLKQVNRCLVMPRKERQYYMVNLRGDVQAFLDTNPHADFDELVRHFGTPQGMGDKAIEDNPPTKLRHYMHRHTWARVMLVVVVVLILGAGLTFALERVFYAANGNPIVYIEQPTIVKNDFPDYYTKSTSEDQ